MPDRELRHMRRTELVEIILALKQSEDRLRAENAALSAQLQERQIHIENAGSIAQAALELNKVFEAAQAAALPYSFQYFIVHCLILISEMIVCFLSAKRSIYFYWRNDRLMLWAKAIVFLCRPLATCKSTIFW